MPIATVVAVLGIINGLLAVVKALPSVKVEIQSLLEKIAPHVNAAGADAQAAYIAAKQTLVDPLQKRIDPATGAPLNA